MEHLKTLFTDFNDTKIGMEEKPSEEESQMIDEFEKAFSNLKDLEKPYFFRNIIISRGQCGFANSGVLQYLINTDRANRYRVTIRTYTRSGINNGQYDYSVIINPGARLYLGCTKSNSIPVTSYSRQVVGEQRI